MPGAAQNPSGRLRAMNLLDSLCFRPLPPSSFLVFGERDGISPVHSVAYPVHSVTYVAGLYPESLIGFHRNLGRNTQP